MNRFAATIRELRFLDMMPDAVIARMSRDDVQSKATPSLVSAGRNGAIAEIPIQGAIASRQSFVDGWEWETSYEGIAAMFDAAIADSSVGGVAMMVDSPGGMHSGMAELADHIRSRRGEKPIAAYVTGMSASAAYGLSAAADRVFAAPSALVGSIGTYVMHNDVSAMAERIGVKVTFIHAGRFKVDGNAFEPLSETARADLQAIVDHGYGQFVDVVAAGRGVSASVVRGPEFGEGRVFVADEAKKRGLIDGVKTMGQFFEAMGQSADSGAIDRRRRALNLKSRICA